jgi:hypothetical protein
MATLRMGEGSAVAAEYPLLILSIRVATFPESNRSPLVIPTEAKRSGGICSCCGPLLEMFFRQSEARADGSCGLRKAASDLREGQGA